MSELLDSILLELRRGTIILSVLSLLKQPQYGYSLVVLLEEKGLPVDAGTLYPLLRRLEKQGLLQSSWDTDTAKPRKYYQMNDAGRTIYAQLCAEWSHMTEQVNAVIQDNTDA